MLGILVSEAVVEDLGSGSLSLRLNLSLSSKGGKVHNDCVIEPRPIEGLGY